MTKFYNVILKVIKVINDYKYMLKRNLAVSEYKAKVRNLGIKRMHIRNAEEVKLYNIGLKIISELEKEGAVFAVEEAMHSYNGAKGFLQHLKELLAQYVVETGKVVHIAQTASCALINLIQLLHKAREKVTDELKQEIDCYSHVIIKHGNKEQKRMLGKLIREKGLAHMNTFLQALQ